MLAYSTENPFIGDNYLTQSIDPCGRYRSDIYCDIEAFLNDWIDDESAKKKVKELRKGENYSWSELDKDGDLWWFYVARLDDYDDSNE